MAGDALGLARGGQDDILEDRAGQVRAALLSAGRSDARPLSIFVSADPVREVDGLVSLDARALLWLFCRWVTTGEILTTIQNACSPLAMDEPALGLVGLGM